MNSYQAILDALLALDDKRLAWGLLYNKNIKCGCAMGAFIPASLREETGEDISVAVGDGAFDFVNDEYETYCTDHGVTVSAVHAVQTLNDSVSALDETPEERYRRVVATLTEWAKKEPCS